MNDKDQIRSLETRVEHLEWKISKLILVRPEKTGLLVDVRSQIVGGVPPVRALRPRCFMTQHELAQSSGVAAHAISRVENGASFGLRTAQKLAAARDDAMDDLSR